MGIALFIRFWVNSRGWGGMQHFTSYGKALFTIIVERILMIGATLLIVAAILLFFTGH